MGSGNGLRANSRDERRFAIARINGMPPDLSGAGSLIDLPALPVGGQGRRAPIAPRASLVSVLMASVYARTHIARVARIAMSP